MAKSDTFALILGIVRDDENDVPLQLKLPDNNIQLIGFERLHNDGLTPVGCLKLSLSKQKTN